jgi:hypothetical protein
MNGAVRGGVCEGCGQAAETLSPWRRYDQVRAPRDGVAKPPPTPGRTVETIRHSPRYEVRLTELMLCSDCHAALAAEEGEALKRSRRATVILAAIAVVVGLISLAGPPFWPVIVHLFAGATPMEAASERSAQTPMSPYKPPDLVPLNQTAPPGR